MYRGDPPSKRRCLGTSHENDQDNQKCLQLHCQIEECYVYKCLCDIQEEDLKKYVTLNLLRLLAMEVEEPSVILKYTLTLTVVKYKPVLTAE